MNRTVEFRAWMAGIVAICTLAMLSSVVPRVENAVGVALVVVLIIALAGWQTGRVVRRERRIRARLADPRIRHAAAIAEPPTRVRGAA